MKKINRIKLFLAAGVGTFIYTTFSAGASGAEGGHAAGGATTLLWIAILLLAAKLSSLIERWGQPSVLGELLVGVVLGNLGLIGIHILDPIGEDKILPFLAELGAIVLLFQVGLESNISKMKAVGARAFMVAIVGVVVPFLLGTYVVGPWLFPGISFNAYLFLGAALTATSVGITARVFKDLGKLHNPEAQMVLGAAVIDDVMGLIILAVVSAIVTAGSVGAGTILSIILKAVAFLVLAILLGQRLAPRLGRLFSRIHTGHGMKFTLAIGFGLVISYLAQKIGLAPIVGAFAAGLILDPVHFKDFSEPVFVRDVKDATKSVSEDVRQEINHALDHHKNKHVEDLLEPLGFFLIPLFFIMTGFQVDLHTLFDGKTLMLALGITLAAFLGKIVAGAVAGNVNKWVVGWGMVPRGEVGLIFAGIGLQLGAISSSVFSVVVIMVIFTTLFTPPVLTHLLKKQK